MSANRPDVFQRHRQAKRILRLRQRIINQVTAVLERDAVARRIRANEISLIGECALARVVAELHVIPKLFVQQTCPGVEPDLNSVGPSRLAWLSSRRDPAERDEFV